RFLYLSALYLLLVNRVCGQQLDTSAPDAEPNASSVPTLAIHAETGSLPHIQTHKFTPNERKLYEKDISKIGQRGVGDGFNLYSIEAESALGRDLADEIEQKAVVIKDPAINRYVDGICQKLVAHSDAKTPFTVKILDNREINAFALPGGYLY